tara:strand:- start:173 stop:364 length:192 start_codon:yes stop_codon:yes gene_type:complete
MQNYLNKDLTKFLNKFGIVIYVQCSEYRDEIGIDGVHQLTNQCNPIKIISMNIQMDKEGNYDD